MTEELDSQLGVRDEDNDEHHQEPSNVFSALTDNERRNVNITTLTFNESYHEIAWHHIMYQ